MSAAESKIELTDRLRYEGLWTEACVYRDKVRRRLRAEGISRQEAGHAAWQAVRERYPSEDPPQVKALHSLLVDASFGPSAHGGTGSGRCLVRMPQTGALPGLCWPSSNRRNSEWLLKKRFENSWE